MDAATPTGSVAAVGLDGSADVLRAAEDLAARLPDQLAPLARLAFNYRWSWLPGAPELFQSLDPARFALCLQNPVRLLQELSADTLHRAAQDAGLVRRAAELEAQLTADLNRPDADTRFHAAAPVAFLCSEYGVHVSLPVYSGGLGALAGDILKEASDRALPMVAVGLMYRKGYFRQRIDASGWQHEYWVDTDPDRLPAALVRTADGHAADDRGPDRRGRGEGPDLARGRRPGAAVSARQRHAARTHRSNAGSPGACTTVTGRPAWPSTRCSAWVGSARCGRWASSPG